MLTDFDHVEVPLTLRSELEISNPVATVKHDENEKATTEHLLPCIENVTDPACFVNIKLSPEDINIGLKLENQDFSSINFPVTRGRKCNSSWKTCSLPDGSVRQRNWLVYSQKIDAVFCLHCTPFALPTERTICSTTGYRGWVDHHGERDVELHEKSTNHLSTQITRIQWMSKKRIDIKLSEQSDQFVQHNREVLKVIIDCCRYLSEEMLAFRKKYALQGKLMILFRMLAKYSPEARVYLEKIDKANEMKTKLGSNFLSYF